MSYTFFYINIGDDVQGVYDKLAVTSKHVLIIIVTGHVSQIQINQKL